MTGQDQRQAGGKKPSVGSIVIVFILKIVGGFFNLFHIKGKWSCGNMKDEERKVFSPMIDGMKQDMTQKDR